MQGATHKHEHTRATAVLLMGGPTEHLIAEYNIERPDPSDIDDKSALYEHEYKWQWIILASYFFRYWGLFQVFTMRQQDPARGRGRARR